MDEEARLEQVDITQPTPPPRFRPYYSLLWLSRRLGRAATGQLTNVRNVLKKEVHLPSTEQLLGTSDPLGLRREQPNNQPQKPQESLKNIVEKSHEVLMKAQSVWPFALFPDTVIVDRTKVTIIQRNFFWSENVTSIRIEDVLNATVSTDLIFGSLNVSSRVMNSTDHYTIKFFWKQDAMRLKHIIQGYVIAQHNNIEIAHLPKDELIETLLELGTDTKR